MRRLSGFMTGIVIAASAAGLAFAEDETMIDAPEVSISREAGALGIYLRGDIGYAAFRDEGRPEIVGRTLDRFDEARFSAPVSGTLGLGARFTDILRADLTAELFESRFSGRTDGDDPCAAGDAGTGCSTRYRADARALGLMANGYVDLATLAGFTPYLGAGLGATYLDARNVSGRVQCVDGIASCEGDFVSTRYSGADGWRLTYALMAGASYDITDRLKLDIGYRYSDIAGSDLFRGNGRSGRDDGLARHEIRAGLRFSFY